MNALDIPLNEDDLGCWSIVIGICENIFGPKHVMESCSMLVLAKEGSYFLGGSEYISM